MDYYGPMVQLHRFLMAALAAALMTGTAAAWAQQGTAKAHDRSRRNTTNAHAEAARDAELFYEVLLGEITTQAGDPGAGYALMLEAARSSNDERLYQRAADIALAARSGEPALAAVQAWKQAWPHSREANRYLLQILIALNRIGETAIPLKQELTDTPPRTKTSILLSLPHMYRRATDKALAAAIVQQALASDLDQTENGPAAWTAVGRMRLLAGDKAGALEAARHAQALNALDEGPAILALELLEGGTAQADPVVRVYLEGPAPTLELRMAYARILLGLQRYSEAQQQLQTITRDKPELADAWLLQAVLHFQDNRLPEAEASLQHFTDLERSIPDADARRAGLMQAYLLHAQIAEKRGDLAAAQAWLERIENAQELFVVQTRKAALLARQGKLEQARALIRNLLATTPENERTKLLAEVQLLRDAHHYREAYDLQGRVVAQAPEDNDLVYDQAMLADKAGEPEAMERLLRQIMARTPDYHHAYNALGFSLAVRGLRLAEAKALIEKALAYAPGDPAITDSLGWVEFRLGNLPEALRLLEIAYKSRPDAEIAAHLGEVLWSMGEPTRARAIWQEGQKLSADNDTLLDTLQRFGVRP